MEHESGKATRTAAEAGWHVSRYNLCADIPGSDKVAIANLYKGVCGDYAPIELCVMESLDQIPENNPFIAHLAKRGVIVNFDERAALEAQSRIACAKSDGTVALTVCPTMACNFECPYCFENGGRGKMKPEVQDDVVALAERLLDASHAEKLRVTWFGGEPLLAPDVIEALSERLTALADERGCRYSASVFTNGYLLTQDIADAFVRWQVSFAHIPIDGIGAANDATRRLVGGGPTFDRIVSNLRAVKMPCRTLIRANTHAGNVSQLDEMREFVDALAAETGNDLLFYPAALVDCDPADVQDGKMGAYAFSGVEASLRPDARHVPIGEDHKCGAHSIWEVAVDDEGFLYKCVGKPIGQKRYSFGTARDWDPGDPLHTASNPDNITAYLDTAHPVPDEECRECVWLPLCGGGCPHLRLIGKRRCLPFRDAPERFVLSLHSRKAAKARAQNEA